MTYEKIPGGPELLAWFGQKPTFHDAEILSLALNRTGISELKIRGWIGTDAVDQDGYRVLDKHAVVTFTFEDIMDLQLDGFSRQNVINGLVLRYATDRGRAGHYAEGTGRHRNRAPTLLRAGWFHPREESHRDVPSGSSC
ncbi:hypothetical protein HFN60_17470 [Rhizobium leguminosarum]|uniref:immunity 50 family protein n=1 Tax=Rhizobium leguminosarum TaxID=384 RepID=UPI0021BBC8CC|nr:immunity 50 family protein [Rhizobium leguminosarum]MBY5817414.1 hypothetical protein [Rhizobium leguminosarum]